MSGRLSTLVTAAALAVLATAPGANAFEGEELRPGPAAPVPHPGWIGRPEQPFVAHIGPAAWLPQASGIAGYAVSVDRDPSGRPCADPLFCTEDEVDLEEGPGDDALDVGELPEGLSYLHSVAVSEVLAHSAMVGTIPLWVDITDPETRISGVPGSWVDRAVTLRASATDSASGMSDGGAITAIAVDGSPPTINPGATTSVTVFGSGVHDVAYYARDAAGNADDGAVVNGRRDPLPETATVRIDRDPPRVAFLPSTHPDEPELLEARVADALSGPDAARGWIGVRPTGSAAAYERLPTAADGDRLQARWNSDDYPPGEYEFAALGRDRAGNTAVGTRRLSGAPMALPSPLKTPTSLAARLTGLPGSGSIAYGRGVVYRGSLTLPSGAALGGAAVRVVERFAPGAAEPQRVSTIETEADGSFALRLAPGPSRTVEATFAGSPSRARVAAPAETLKVRAAVSLRASARVASVGGRPVLFSGRVAGEVPRGGLPVELQFHLPGVPWTEFRTIQSDARGRFRYPYAFSDDDSRGVRFLFRARVEAAPGWPYETGSSLPVMVRGR